MIVRLWLSRFVEMPIEVPFAHMACGVSDLFKEKGERKFTFTEMDFAIFGNPSEDTIAIRSTAS